MRADTSDLLRCWGACHAIVGISAAPSEFQADAFPPKFQVCLLMVELWGLTGFIAGMLPGRTLHIHIPLLNAFLAKLSALTVGIFAVNVTAEFIFAGLEEAWAYSSRLSTSTTIFMTAL
jgi:hypothetical protein